MRRPRELAVDHSMHFLQLLHQVVLGVQPASRVDEEPTGITSLCSHNGVVGHGRGIGLIGTGDDGNFQSASPQLELLNSGSAKGVAGGEDRRLSALSHALGQLSTGGRFSGSIHTDHRDHRHTIRPGYQRRIHASQTPLDFIDGDVDEVQTRLSLSLEGDTDCSQDLLGHGQTQVGRQ